MANDIKKYNFKAGLPIEFEIVDLNQLYKINKDILTHPHRTAFYHVLWFQKGNPIHLVDFRPFSPKSNTILFLNKDVVHRFDPRGNFDGKAILFTENFFCQTDADMQFLHTSILFNDLFIFSSIQIPEQNQHLVHLFNIMTDEVNHLTETCHADILKSLLHSFLLFAERERLKQNFAEIKKGADFDYVMAFKQILEKSFRKQKHVSCYAQQLNITEKRLSQATSKVLGSSPKEMISERILLEAKRLLVHTNESVKEIGYTLGFEDPTYFIKYFRKHTHKTPLEFRKYYINS
ncbi:MAG: AraC family transcriptional regulator [Chitinophagales bacterium]